jgi:hypothetical protein
MPTLGVALNLLYKLQSGTNYLIAGQYTTGSIDAIIDDLTPGEYYTIAVQAFSAFGIGSTVRVVTGTNALAPVNTTVPTTPTGGAISSKVPAVLTWEVSSLYFGAHVSWSVNSDKDFAYFEVKSTTTNSDAADDYIWFSANAIAGLYQTREPFFDYYRQSPQNGHVRIRAVNRSGTASSWHYAGNIASFSSVIGGDMSLQNKSAVAISGGTVTGITDIALADGGTGASTAANARINLLPAYAGNGLKTLALNSGATDVEWSAAGTGTVISVAGTGTVNGITLTGTVTASGSLTLGGTLADVSLTTSVTGTLPIANGGTAATTPSGARDALLPDYSGNALKVLAVNSGETDVEWSAAGSGTVTSVALSGGTTGLTFSGSPVTTSGTITVAGTLAIASGGTGATTESGARTALGLGSLAVQDSSATSVSSLIVAASGATNPRANLAIFANSVTYSFTGGASSENVDFDLTNRGFSAKPDWGIIQIYDTNFLGVYDFFTASSATNARFVVFSIDGGNLASGDKRCHFLVGKY